jgi:hypothetical protein
MGPRAVLDAAVKRKIPNPSRESNPRTPIVRPVAQQYRSTSLTTQREQHQLLEQIVIADETWVQHYGPESKAQSMA